MDILLGFFISVLTVFLVLSLFCIAVCIVGVVLQVVRDGSNYIKKKKCKYAINDDGIYKTQCGHDFYDSSESGDIES